MCAGTSPSARKTATSGGDVRGRARITRALASAGCVLLVTALLVVFNGGVAVGSSTHAGLVPVVRQFLDPAYLPGDFNISLRRYHHRVFVYLVAVPVAALGEDRGLIVIGLLAVLGLAAALFALCRSCGLSGPAYVAVGALLAVQAGWTGRGLEGNTLVGSNEITAATLAHAALLGSVAMLVRRRYRAAALLAGVTATLHLQIGAVFALFVAPFAVRHALEAGAREAARLALLFTLPLSPALWHLWLMLGRGLASPAVTLEYLQFRMPHHFALASRAAAAWIAAHLLVLALCYGWLRRTRHDGRRGVGVLLAIGVAVAALALVHGVSYYALHWMPALKLQFLRLSPLISLCGVIGLLVTLTAWAARRGGNRLAQLVPAALLLVAAGQAGVRVAEGEYAMGVTHRAQSRSAWVDVCAWIRAHGPRGTPYVTPPGQEGFTYLTDRSNVVEFKINPDGGQSIDEWYARLRDLSGGTLSRARGFANEPLLDTAYAALDGDQLAAVGRKYGARHAVVPQASAVAWPVLHENRGYRLVELPP